jgi:hypothetical protein
MTSALKILFEAEGWEVKGIGKTKLSVIGKKGNPTQELELRSEKRCQEPFRTRSRLPPPQNSEIT